MKKILACRRTFVSVLAIVCLTALGLYKGMDTSMAIAGIAAALSGSNAWEAKRKKEEPE